MRAAAALIAGAAAASAAKPLPTRAELRTAAGAAGKCAPAGVCVEPPAKYKKVYPIKPRQQWNINGGFCGALSIQAMLMSQGAWVSQDLVRKANDGGACFGHGAAGMGCEVGPENYGKTAEGLRLKYDEWDYAAHPKPQAAAFKSFIKAHLVKGHPVMWAPMEKGGSHTPYGPKSCPGGGHFDHHEPMIGIGSNHPLSDATVYADDWLLHFSDQDLMPYYRNFSSLEDSTAMDGNCKHSSTGYPGREAVPCFFEDVAYGLAINGLDTKVASLPVNIDVDVQDEPNVRSGAKATDLHATVQVHGLTAGGSYVLYRYTGINSFPASDPTDGYEVKTPFQATGDAWEFKDPKPFLSSGATYYLAVEA